MALPEYSLKQLLESGVHFGHQTHRWNPLMEDYIYGVRNGIHIIDLTQTFTLLDTALNSVFQAVSKGGSILFVGTKRQAQRPIAEAAERSAQYYMNHRWLGGTLTNWKTVSNSIARLKKLDEQLSDGATGLTKKERLNLEREQSKLSASLGGIREMGGLPDLLFVVDTNKESLAIQEAKKLGIPVIAILDTNSDPSNIDFPIPGNDDAARSIIFYCDLIAKAALEGMTNQLASAGVDLGGTSENLVEEIIPIESKIDENAASKTQSSSRESSDEKVNDAKEEKSKDKTESTTDNLLELEKIKKDTPTNKKEIKETLENKEAVQKEDKEINKDEIKLKSKVDENEKNKDQKKVVNSSSKTPKSKSTKNSEKVLVDSSKVKESTVVSNDIKKPQKVVKSTLKNTPLQSKKSSS